MQPGSAKRLSVGVSCFTFERQNLDAADLRSNCTTSDVRTSGEADL